MKTLTPGIYAHYNGGRYTVLSVGTEMTNGAPFEGRVLVAYLSFTYDGLKFRELSEFTEPVEWPDGVVRPRFVKVNP